MTTSWIRRPRVAGYVYPRDPAHLRATLAAIASPIEERMISRAVIVPHGSDHMSGSLTGDTLRRLRIPSRCVILSPNHAGQGASWSLMATGSYQTPLGTVPIDEVMAHDLLDACPLVMNDPTSHAAEHGIETILPFLQWLGPADLQIVPLILDSDDPVECEAVGSCLARLIGSRDDATLVVASADLTHYEPREAATQKDQRLLASIQTLEAPRILAAVREQQMITCGAGPIACVVEIARGLGASTAQVIDYRTSADAGGDPASAIGYAGIVLN